MKLLGSLLVVMGAWTLVACASQAPTPSSAIGTSHDGAPARVAAAQKQDNRSIPEGYRRVIVNGEERFCRTDTEPGSRVKKDTVCLTREQLDAQRDSTRDFMNNLSRENSMNSGSRGNMPMSGPY